MESFFWAHTFTNNQDENGIEKAGCVVIHSKSV